MSGGQERLDRSKFIQQQGLWLVSADLSHQSCSSNSDAAVGGSRVIWQRCRLYNTIRSVGDLVTSRGASEVVSCDFEGGACVLY